MLGSSKNILKDDSAVKYVNPFSHKVGEIFFVLVSASVLFFMLLFGVPQIGLPVLIVGGLLYLVPGFLTEWTFSPISFMLIYLGVIWLVTMGYVLWRWYRSRKHLDML